MHASVPKFLEWPQCYRLERWHGHFNQSHFLWLAKRLVLRRTSKEERSNHEGLSCESMQKITQDGGDYRVVLFVDHAWSAWANGFPAKKVINR